MRCRCIEKDWPHRSTARGGRRPHYKRQSGSDSVWRRNVLQGCSFYFILLFISYHFLFLLLFFFFCIYTISRKYRHNWSYVFFSAYRTNACMLLMRITNRMLMLRDCLQPTPQRLDLRSVHLTGAAINLTLALLWSSYHYSSWRTSKSCRFL